MKREPYHIAKDYRVLHHDEFPILFSGLNEAGERIVGSFIEETDEGEMFYFYSLVNEVDFIRFVRREISYLGLLKNAQQIYILSKNLKGRVKKVRATTFQTIPSDSLPLPSAFCPTVEAFSLA